MWLNVPATPAPAPHHHELRIAQVPQGGQVFIWSIRQWMVSRRNLRCVGCDLSPTYNRFNCKSAIMHLDQFMRRLVEAPARPLELRHPQFPTLSHDERIMLRVLQAACEPRETTSARKAAEQLVCAGAGELCDCARRYGQAITPAGLRLSSFRQLRLAWSASS